MIIMIIIIIKMMMIKYILIYRRFAGLCMLKSLDLQRMREENLIKVPKKKTDGELYKYSYTIGLNKKVVFQHTFGVRLGDVSSIFF